MELTQANPSARIGADILANTYYARNNLYGTHPRHKISNNRPIRTAFKGNFKNVRRRNGQRNERKQGV